MNACEHLINFCIMRSAIISGEDYIAYCILTNVGITERKQVQHDVKLVLMGT